MSLRETLKSYFQAGSAPTAGHFAALIDAVLVSPDDGITVRGQRLGVGTADPQATLDVAGDMYVRGTLRGDGSGLTGLDPSQLASPVPRHLVGGMQDLEARVSHLESSPPLSLPAVPPAASALEALSQRLDVLEAAEASRPAADPAAEAQRADGLPVGAVVMWSGSDADIPKGWALCDGRLADPKTGAFIIPLAAALARHPEEIAALYSRAIAPGATADVKLAYALFLAEQLRVSITEHQTQGWVLTPDLQDRFVVGAGRQFPAHKTGGERSVTLTAAHLPRHTHVASQAPHKHKVKVPVQALSVDDRNRQRADFMRRTQEDSARLENYPQIERVEMKVYPIRESDALESAVAPSITLGETGAASPTLDILPPYHALCFIIKVA